MSRNREVAVHLLDLGAVPAEPAYVLGGDLAAAQLIRDRRERRHFLARRGTVRRLLGHVLELPPAEVPVERGRNGKPEVPGGAVHSSVATRDATCAIALCGAHPVRVALAPVPAEPPPAAGPARLAPAGAAGSAAGPARRAWAGVRALAARTEAAVRARGTGLAEARQCLDAVPQAAPSRGDRPGDRRRPGCSAPTAVRWLFDERMAESA
jgi:hypothetical protein